MPSLHVHFLIAETAEAMARSLYDDLMKDNRRYKAFKKLCPDLTPQELESRWIALWVPKLLESARATLAQMLTTNIPEAQKETIADALVKDNILRRGRLGRRMGDDSPTTFPSPIVH